MIKPMNKKNPIKLHWRQSFCTWVHFIFLLLYRGSSKALTGVHTYCADTHKPKLVPCQQALHSTLVSASIQSSYGNIP